MKRLLVVVPMSILGSLLALGACAASDDDSGAGGTAGVGATGGADGGGGTGGADGGGGSGGTTSDAGTTTITGTILALTDQTTPVSGMKVCVYQNAGVPCVQTDANGDYALGGVPASADVALEYTKTSYQPVLVTVKTVAGPMSVGQFFAPTQTEVSLLAASVGVTLNAQKGLILTTAFQGTPGSFTGQDNVTNNMSPKSGAGPYYLNAAGNAVDTSLTVTSTAGIGVFANVDPGDVEITMSHFTKTCQRLSTSWAGSTANASKVKVVAGYLTGGAGLVCP